MQRRVLMVTTDSLDGMEVREYIGTLSAHFVIGTGLFSDIFSAFTDFFGAHSRSYQTKLDRISDEAMSLLEEKAFRQSADAVLGLRLDHDEISGAGKSMLMVTATGTAVKLSTGGDRGENPRDHGGGVSGWELQNALKLRRLFAAAEQEGTSELFADSNWAALLQHLSALEPEGVIGLIDHRINWADRDYRRFASQYLSALEAESARDLVYGLITSVKPDTAAVMVMCARERHFLDFEKVVRLLRSGDRVAQLRALSLTVAGSPMYGKEELQSLRDLEAAVLDTFPAGRVSTKAVGLRAKEAEVWRCQCGNWVRLDRESCNKCFRDRRGLFNDEAPLFSAAVESLAARIAFLEEVVAG